MSEQSKKTLAIIGCGRVSKTLGWLFYRNEVLDVAQLYSRRETSAVEAQNFIGSGDVVSDLSQINADIILIATSDDQIADVANDLASKLDVQGRIILHCSGALSSDLLSPLAEKGAHTASIHPLKSFANPQQLVRNFTGTVCTYEGSESCAEYIMKCFKQIGAQTSYIQKDKKTLYHAALASVFNHSVTMLEKTRRLLDEAGLEEDLIGSVLQTAYYNAADNFNQYGFALSMTGPLVRGDADVLKAHLDALSSHPDMQNLYKAWGLQTAKWLKEEMAEEKFDRIIRLFS